jgi:hypothetical protein
MNPQCSFCGKHQSEVERLIAGPSVFICDGCVRLCADVLEYRARPMTAVEARGVDGKVRQALRPTRDRQILIRLPDGSVHTGIPTTPWRTLTVSGERIQWCAARAYVRGPTPVHVVAVQRPGADGPAAGAAFGSQTKLTRAHAKDIALRYLLRRID